MVDNLRQFLQADFITIHSPKFMIPNIVITNILNLLPFKKKKKTTDNLSLSFGTWPTKIKHIKSMTPKEQSPLTKHY